MKKLFITSVFMIVILSACTRAPLSPTSGIILVTEEQMAVIESLPKDVICLTSATNPISTLEGVKDDEFASWVSSPEIPQKLMAAFGRQDTVVGLNMIGTANEDAYFDNNPNLRLFITDAKVDNLIRHGGMKIEFKVKQ